MDGRKLTATLIMSAQLSTACGGQDGVEPFGVAWSFPMGDCASNDVETVRVTVLQSGAEVDSGEFACTDGRGDLSELSSGSYDVEAEGLAADGTVMAVTYGISTSFGDSGRFGDLEFTLFPRLSDVLASWNGCPGVTVPFFITIYDPPATPGGALTDEVTSVQESCASGEVTLVDVPAGEFVIELDSRAVSPAVYDTQPLTTTVGEDQTVSFSVP